MCKLRVCDEGILVLCAFLTTRSGSIRAIPPCGKVAQVRGECAAERKTQILWASALTFSSSVFFPRPHRLSLHINSETLAFCLKTRRLTQLLQKSINIIPLCSGGEYERVSMLILEIEMGEHDFSPLMPFLMLHVFFLRINPSHLLLLCMPKKCPSFHLNTKPLVPSSSWTSGRSRRVESSSSQCHCHLGSSCAPKWPHRKLHCLSLSKFRMQQRYRPKLQRHSGRRRATSQLRSGPAAKCDDAGLEPKISVCHEHRQ